MSARIKGIREALLHARMLLPRVDPTTIRGEISRAIIDALDALTDEVEELVEERGTQESWEANATSP